MYNINSTKYTNYQKFSKKKWIHEITRNYKDKNFKLNIF